MATASRALLTGLIDYAGLFPPARLELTTALERYESHLREPEAWMLARLIVPAARLDELAALISERGASANRLRLSVLFGGGRDRAAAAGAAIADLRRIEAFHAEHGEHTAVEAFETRWPDDIALSGDLGLLRSALTELLERLAAYRLPACDLAVEAPGDGEPADRDAPAVAALAAANQAGLPANVERLAYKVRCGGVEPSAFPSVERLAGVLIACRDAGVALKATAGLHHPLRHRAVTPAVMMHGFLNLFGAGMLVHAAGVDVGVAVACLEETDPNAFSADSSGLGWQGCSIPVEDVVRLRSERLLGFGSCSFDEPRDDLRALGLLD